MAVRIGLPLMAVGLVALATCRHGFFLRPGGEGRLGFLESSGIVKSRTYRDVFWTHADSASPASLIAIRANGETVASIPVDGAKNFDWEDVAVDDAGFLYVGDIGNNGNRRRNLAVYKVREPDPKKATSTSVVATIRFSFPDQREFPPEQENFDAESLFWTNGRLYLLTKHRSDTHTKLYRFPSLDGRAPVVLDKINEFDVGGQQSSFGGMVTAADIRPQGDFLAVLSYHALFIFRAPEQGDDFFAVLHKRIDFGMSTMKQCEGVTWDGDDVVITNESGAIFRIENVFEPALNAFPAQ
jgi:hypothetical protein